MCLVPLEAQFYVLIPRKNPLKSELGKISYESFCNVIQIMKNVDI